MALIATRQQWKSRITKRKILVRDLYSGIKAGTFAIYCLIYYACHAGSQGGKVMSMKKKARAVTRGIMYILSNEAMPGLVKIGHAKTAEGVKSRLSQLYTTGVPVPFKCEFAMQVNDAPKWEQRLHKIFRDARVNSRREFFKVDPDDLIPLLREGEHGKNVTLAVNTQIKGISRADVNAKKRLEGKQPKRPPMRLSDLNIRKGTVLVSRKAGSESEKCKVVDADKNKVQFRGKVRAFTEATFIILGEPEWPVTSPAYCSRYWEYRGKSLRKIYEEIFFRT